MTFWTQSKAITNGFCACDKNTIPKLTPRSYVVVCAKCEGIRYVESVTTTVDAKLRGLQL